MAVSSGLVSGIGALLAAYHLLHSKGSATGRTGAQPPVSGILTAREVSCSRPAGEPVRPVRRRVCRRRGGYVGVMADLIRAVLFDVDGTLVDSNYLNTVAWWEAFAQAGHDVQMARIHRAIGKGSDQLLGELLPADRDQASDDEIAAAHAALYSVYWSRLRPLPGAARLLRACHENGLRVVLASSAGPRELEVLRAALDADDAIDAVTSAGDVDESKPAPDLVQVALQKAGTSPRGAVFVGDAVWDARACGRAGVSCVGVLSGGTSEAELRAAGAIRVYPGPAELLAAFPASLLG